MDQANHISREKILYIDDNETNLFLFYEMYKEAYNVIITSSKDEALEQIKSGEYKVIFVDYLMPEISGLDFIMQASQISPDSLYIIITAHANLDVAISAINHGSVFRFIEKPWKAFEINSAIKEAVALFDLKIQNKNLIENIKQKNRELILLKDQLEEENHYLQEEIISTSGFEDIISKDPAFKSVLKKVEQVSGTMATVLILGETGTGKELIARAIHKLSKRSTNAFIKLNCAAIPETLIESELFGHRKGAFTGALEHKKGKFELADHGTIFLDEVGELPLLMQPKLLRVLQEGEIEKLGGETPIHVDVRVIAATNRDLEKEMKTGGFRDDLYYRLNVFPITLPPLRERTEDIPILVDHFIKKFNRINNKKIKKVTRETMGILCRYQWPGNIRELENVIERAIIISNGTQLDLMDGLSLRSSKPAMVDTQLRTLEKVEKDYIEKVLRATSFRVSGEKGAARILGMNPTTLESRIKKLGIIKS